MSETPNSAASGDAQSGRKEDESIVRGLLVWALVFALFAGAVAAGVAESTQGRFLAEFVPPAGFDALGAYEQNDVRSRMMREATALAETRNAMLAYGALGGILGCALGLAGGLARGSPRSGLAAGVAGAILGVLAAAGGAAAAGWLFFRLAAEDTGIVPPLSAHLMTMAALGAGAGLALGIGRGGGKGALALGLMGGVFGGLAGAFLYEIIFSTLDPLMRNEAPVPPTRQARVALQLIAAAGVALLA
ncbi:MAG: hypothetical protein AB7I30_08720, partial [Isosphaeraceae bacterium]